MLAVFVVLLLAWPGVTARPGPGAAAGGGAAAWGSACGGESGVECLCKCLSECGSV